MGFPRGILLFFVISALLTIWQDIMLVGLENSYIPYSRLPNAASVFHLVRLPIWPAGPPGPGSPSGSTPGKGINP